MSALKQMQNITPPPDDKDARPAYRETEKKNVTGIVRR